MAAAQLKFINVLVNVLAPREVERGVGKTASIMLSTAGGGAVREVRLGRQELIQLVVQATRALGIVEGVTR